MSRAIQAAVVRDGRAIVRRNMVGQATTDWGARVTFGLGTGSPDLVGLLVPTGRVFCLEVKTPTGRLSREQVLWAKACRKRGGFCSVARSVEEAIACLDRAVLGASE